MTQSEFEKRKNHLEDEYNKLIERKNKMLPSKNGLYNLYEYEVLTRDHVPLTWRYDFLSFLFIEGSLGGEVHTGEINHKSSRNAAIRRKMF